jgi:hypothetical protein
VLLLNFKCGPSITHKDDHFAKKTALKYDTKKFKFWDSAFVVCPGLSVQFISETIRD